MDEIWQRYSDGEALYADSNKINNGKQYKTPKGRIVYGGGGIMPDIFVPLDTSTFQRSSAKVILDGTLYKFVYLYYLQHKSQLQEFATPEEFVKDFNNVNEMWHQLVQYSLKDTINLNTVPETDKLSLEKRLKANLARFRWRSEGYYEVLNTDDPVIKKAIEVLEK